MLHMSMYTYVYVYHGIHAQKNVSHTVHDSHHTSLSRDFPCPMRFTKNLEAIQKITRNCDGVTTCCPC